MRHPYTSLTTPTQSAVNNVFIRGSVVRYVHLPSSVVDVGLLEGVAEILDEPAATVLPPSHLRKYRDQLAAIGLDREEFLATYSLVIRIRPTRFFPWHGRTTPASADARWTRADRRLQAAIRRVAASVATTAPRPAAAAG